MYFAGRALQRKNELEKEVKQQLKTG